MDIMFLPEASQVLLYIFLLFLHASLFLFLQSGHDVGDGILLTAQLNTGDIFIQNSRSLSVMLNLAEHSLQIFDSVTFSSILYLIKVVYMFLSFILSICLISGCLLGIVRSIFLQKSSSCLRILKGLPDTSHSIAQLSISSGTSLMFTGSLDAGMILDTSGLGFS